MNACTSACTSITEAGHESTPEGPADSSDSQRAGGETPPTDPPAAGLTGRQLAEAIAAVERLPLSDAERAEAVRRLLAGSGPGDA